MAEAAAQAHLEQDEDITPRSDFRGGVGWMLLGAAVLVGSITMDRLEQQNINPYTIPGLLPGLLGMAMLLLGGVLALRSWRRGAFSQPVPPFTAHQREIRKRVWTVIALCSIYSVPLIGHGLPFWVASTIFVTGTILIMQRMSQDPEERRLTPRLWLKAIVIGLASAVVTQLVFQELFLVRLP
jgi:putative tricarboxylic transport membrane protein